MRPKPPFKPWGLKDVVDAGTPAFAARTYLEQADVRRYLLRAAAEKKLAAACEVGCGYGRMVVVLAEAAARVVGFERQPEFLEEARRLHPRIEFRPVETLARLDAEDASFDFVLTFTVLQHLTNPVAARAAAEIKRVVSPGGFVLLCEETDEGHLAGDIEDENGICTIGRSVSRYAALFAPLRLLAVSPRRIEPTYARPDVGTYLFFRK